MEHVRAEGGCDSSLGDIIWIDWHLEVALREIKLREDTSSADTGCEVRYVRHGIVVRLYDDTEASVVCSGDAQGLADLRAHAHLLHFSERFFGNLGQFRSEAMIPRVYR